MGRASQKHGTYIWRGFCNLSDRCSLAVWDTGVGFKRHQWKVQKALSQVASPRMGTEMTHSHEHPPSLANHERRATNEHKSAGKEKGKRKSSSRGETQPPPVKCGGEYIKCRKSYCASRGTSVRWWPHSGTRYLWKHCFFLRRLQVKSGFHYLPAL